MATLMIVDGLVGLIAPFAETIRQRTRHDVITVHTVEDVGAVMRARSPVDLALVDLSFPYGTFPDDRGSGLEALAEIHRIEPSTLLAIYSRVDATVVPLLRDAWELLPIATVICKSAPLQAQLDAIECVLRTGTSPIDPAIQAHLPPERPTARTVDSFAKLVPHAGHAKLWAALMESDPATTYQQVADRAGLKLNTIKNYRATLLGELRSHGVADPSLDEMRAFALRCRPFLLPHVESALRRVT